MTSVSKLKNVYPEDFRGADKVGYSKSAKWIPWFSPYPNPRTT